VKVNPGENHRRETRELIVVLCGAGSEKSMDGGKKQPEKKKRCRPDGLGDGLRGPKQDGDVEKGFVEIAVWRNDWAKKGGPVRPTQRVKGG